MKERDELKRERPLTELQRRLVELHDAGMGPTAIARVLGIRRPGTVTTMLETALYKAGR